MQRLLTILAGAFALGVAVTGVARAQATIDDCEKIQAADAYNQCLAKFGPPSKLKNLEPGKPSDFKNNSDEAAATAAPPIKTMNAHAKSSRRGTARKGRGARRASHGGRKRMVISVGRHRRR